MQPRVLFKKTHPAARIPKQAYDTDAGYDLYSIDHVILKPGERAMVRTGLQMALPEPFTLGVNDLSRGKESTIVGYEVRGPRTMAVLKPDVTWMVKACWEAQVRPRSGAAFKKGLTVINTPGTIDSGYRGDVNVLLVNLGDEEIEIQPGDRIAQLVFNLTVHPQLVEVAELPQSDRGEGGFGSTGGIQ